jgi:hypothetical protein
MSRAPRLLLVLIALGTAWQVFAGAVEPRGRALRMALALLGLLGAWACLQRRPRTALGASAAALLPALALLEATLARTELAARGALGFAAGTLVAAWLLAQWAAPRPRGARLAERLLLASATAASALFAVESIAFAAVGVHTYDPLALAPRRGPCLFRDEHGTARGNPGFRGRYVHREFYGKAVAINALGLRDDPPEELPPAPGEAVVFCLGDSFTFGLGVALEDTFQERLEGLLGSPPPRVFGAGIPGFGTRDARVMLAELAQVAAPDVVVLALFEDNDFQDTLSARERGPLPPPARPGAAEPPAPVPLLAFLEELQTGLFWRERAACLQLGSRRGTGLPSLFLKEVLAGDPSGRCAPLVDVLFDELGLLAGDVEALGAELIVLLVPAALQAEPERFERYRAGLPAGERPAGDRLCFHAAIAARLAGAGYRSADPLPLLEAEARAGRSGYHVEGHWNALGHATAARTLAPLVRDALGVD